MAKTDFFRTQHKELLGLVGEIAAALDAEKLAADPAPARDLLSKLGTRIGVHLKMEDSKLYPDMVNSGNDEAKSMAEKFQAEMGDLAGAFTTYSNKWQLPEIKENPNGFIAETKGIADALGKRIEREESELYELADRC